MDEKYYAFWQVWSLNNNNNRNKFMMFVCESNNKEDIQNKFEKEMRNHHNEIDLNFYRVKYQWENENIFNVFYKNNDNFIYQIEKI